MLLYKLDHFRCDVIVPSLSIKGADLLDGYVRTFCLWRKYFSYMLPLLVTVAYVPPGKPYCRELRRAALFAVPKIVKWVSGLWRGSQPVVVAHINAADGCMDLKTSLATVLSPQYVEELPSSEAGYDPVGRGMWFVRSEDGEVVHRRDEIGSISTSSVAGKSFSAKLAKLGFLPCMGASEPLRPSSWQGCKKCPRGVCRCERSVARGQHDVCYVQQETLWNGVKTGMLKSTVRRLLWSTKIDHSLVTLALPLFGQRRCLPPVPRIKSDVNRLKIPGELLRREVFLINKWES